MQKLWLLAAVLLLVAPCAHAQFGWDEEPEQTAATDSFDAFDSALRTPVIEPIRPIRPVMEPVVPVFQPFVSPVVDVDPLVEQCDLEPAVTQVYRASVLSDSTRHSPQGTRHIGEADCPQFLGRLSANPYGSDSTANPYSPAGSPYSAKSVKQSLWPIRQPVFPNQCS